MAHNQRRSEIANGGQNQPKGSNMQEMVWDNNLALKA